MYNSLNITYNNVPLISYGCILAKIDNKGTEDVYVSDRDIMQDTSGRNWGSKSRNYFYKVQRNPHKFKLELAFKTLNDEIIRDVSKLFFQDRYLPLIADDVYRMYYCMPISSSVNYYGSSGYITLEMVTFDEFTYSPKLTTINKNLTGNASSTFKLSVNGDVTVYPKLSVEPLVSGSTLIIKNLNNNKFIELTTDSKGNKLIANEIIEIDCNKEIITTDQLGLFRYDNMTNDSDYLELESGINSIQVDGSMVLTITYRNKYLF